MCLFFVVIDVAESFSVNVYSEFCDCDDENLYVYGEPIRESLCSLLPKIECIDDKDFTSSLLWISTKATCSPLHCDLTEGIPFLLTVIFCFHLVKNHLPQAF